MTEKELPQGISRLTQKLADNPASRAFVPLADAYLKQNLLEDAILILTQGIQRHPTYVAARMMLGNAYQRAEQVAEAKREFEEVVRVHPENVLAYKKLALLYKEAGQLGEAVKMCQQVLAIDPYDIKAKGLLALVQEEISVVEDNEDDAVSFFPPLPSHGTILSDTILPLPDTISELPVEDDSLDTGTPSPEKEIEYEGVTQLEAPSFGSEAVRENFTAPAGYLPEETLSLACVQGELLLPVEFVSKIEYNRSALHQKRLKEWLFSIQEKGVRR